MTTAEIIGIARTLAAKHALDPALVLALVEQESDFDPWAIRYEPKFYDRYVLPQVANGGISVTEARARAFSWGCMQIMGQTARNHGHTLPLPQLCDPVTGIGLGCVIFARFLERSEGDVRQALLRWNGGGRAEYADEVMERVSRFT